MNNDELSKEEASRPLKAAIPNNIDFQVCDRLILLKYKLDLRVSLLPFHCGPYTFDE